METRFFQHLQTLVPHPEKARFLLTVSGGKDSTVLAHLFQRFNLDFAIAHCNFHLRDTDSDADMDFVKNLAEKFHKGLFIREFDTFSEQKDSGKSIEMTARDLRYEWFNKISATFNYVVTAHHADDNAETILLNLTRGTGLKGLTGIPALNGKFLRPLLPFSSDEILHYAQENRIDFRTDQTNFSEKYQRNKIRLAILPQLQEINPSLIATLTKNIAHFQQQFAFYQREINKKMQSICVKNADSLLISIEKLQNEPDQSILLYETLKPYGFSSNTTAEILTAIDGTNIGQLFFSPTHQLLKDRNLLIIKKIEDSTSHAIIIHDENDLRKAGFEVSRISITEITDFKQDTNSILVDADKLHFPLTIRNWKEGDKFRPFGMRGQQKLSDFFVNQKVNRFQKSQIKILSSENQIVWVIGLRADDRFKVDERTRECWIIRQPQ